MTSALPCAVITHVARDTNRVHGRRHGDVPMTVQAMKVGAVEFLTNPFGARYLLSEAIQRQLSAVTHRRFRRARIV
jgi:FixJ family two-component response regulator